MAPQEAQSSRLQGLIGSVGMKQIFSQLLVLGQNSADSS